MIRIVSTVALLMVMASIGLAAEPPAVEVERQVEAVQPWSFRRLERVREDLRNEEFGFVLDTLREMKRNPTLNSHERGLMWQAFGYAYIGQEKYEEAAAALEECLDTNGLPQAVELHTRYNLAQILVMLEHPKPAIEHFTEWFKHARNPAPTAHYMAAMAYMQDKQSRKAIEHIDRALEIASAPKESWLQLKNAMLVEEKDFASAELVLDELIERFPKKAYWMQLAAVYSETEQHERALTTLELVHIQGLFDQASEYTTLAQMYLFNQMPYQAAKILREGLDSGKLESTSATWQLLADSLLHARDRDAAVAPMQTAAELATDGNVFVRLAQIHIDREEWGDARDTLNLAIQKGNLRTPGHASLLLGIASANEERWGEAERAFTAAQADDKTEKAAVYWLKHLASRREQSEQRRASADGASRVEAS